MTLIEIRETAGVVVKNAAKKLSPLTYISSAVRKMERDEVDALAVAYLMLRLKQNKRAVVAEVEKRTTKPRRDAAAFHRWATDPINAEEVQKDAELQKKYAEIDRRAMEQFQAEMIANLERYKDHLRTEWTEELLSTSIALGDGTTVLWGDATIDQHQSRYDMHMKNAMAGAEGAARHMAAIATLRETHTPNLYEATKVSA
jgi:hypothetical protein